MSPVRVMMKRTCSFLKARWSTPVATCVFLAVGGAFYVRSLFEMEGLPVGLPSLWALSLAPICPILAALLGMDVWSEDLRTGRVDLLLTASVREFDLSLGKFLGVFRAYAGTVLTSLALTFCISRFFLVGPTPSLLSFLLPFFILLVQGALWCAVTVCCSALTRQGAIAAILSVLVTVGLPRGIWAALLAWSPVDRSVWGEMPLDAHVADVASGIVEPGVVVSYLLAAVAFVLASDRFVRARRLVGGGQRGARLSNRIVTLLMVLCTVAAVKLLSGFSAGIDLSPSDSGESLTGRTRGILAEGRGSVRMTLLRPRRAPDYRALSRLMRSFHRAAESQAGLKLDLRYVDPNWDVAEATRLVRLGAADGTIVLERGRQSVLVRGVTGRSEREIASAILQLTAPSRRRSVCWVRGHGELDFASYGPLGMSDIARELSRDGFQNQTLDLASDSPIPADCAFIVIAGAQDDFSRVEVKRIDDYLRSGGRLLVLADQPDAGGLHVALPSLGIRAVEGTLLNPPSMGPGNVIVSEFTRHPVVDSLQGKRIILGDPLSLVPTAAATTGTGADKLEFSPLASVGQTVVAACVERGVGAGSDLSIRPMRIVVVGDSCFVQNARLSAFGSSNGEFFLNCATYLAGLDLSVESGASASGLATGLDRAGFLRLTAVEVVILPLLVLLVLVIRIRRRNR